MSAEFEYTDEVTDRFLVRGPETVELELGIGECQTMSRSLVIVDRYERVEDGALVELSRSFEELDVELEADAMEGGPAEVESGPLEGLTVELSLGVDGVDAELADAEGESSELARLDLEGFCGHLGMEGLLPEEAVEPGDSWSFDATALSEALQLNVGGLLFPSSLKAEALPKGVLIGRGIGHAIKTAEWELEASLAAEHVDYLGTDCIVIDLAGSGVLQPPRRSSSGRARALRWQQGELELEGRALLDAETLLPVRLELDLEVDGQEVRTGRSQRGSVRTEYLGAVTFEADYQQVVLEE
jgi:hypothetical protein